MKWEIDFIDTCSSAVHEFSVADADASNVRYIARPVTRFST